MTIEEKKNIINQYISTKRFRLTDHEIEVLFDIVSNPSKYNDVSKTSSPVRERGPYGNYHSIKVYTYTLVVEKGNMHISKECITSYDDGEKSKSVYNTRNVRDFLNYFFKYFSRW